MRREERLIAAALQSREAFYEIDPLLHDDDLQSQHKAIWEEIKCYYGADGDAITTSTSVILDGLKTKYPRHEKTFENIFQKIEPVSVKNAVLEWATHRKHVLGLRIAESILGNSEHNDTETLIQEWLSVGETGTTATTALLTAPNLEELMTVYSPENMIRCHPKSLNSRLGGGVIRGDQICIFANTEVGKSLFTINLAGWWLRDGLKVLYVGNEDAEQAMIQRLCSNLTGAPKARILSNPKAAMEAAMKRGWGNLHFYPASPGSPREIEALAEKIKPDILVFDQMANMDAGKNLSKTEKNEYLASRCRAMAKKHNFVSVIVHQASADAYNKLVLEKSDLYYSNVGVQGQMDVMIGIGMDSTMEQNDERMITLCKNKASGDHSSFPVRVDKALSRVI